MKMPPERSPSCATRAWRAAWCVTPTSSAGAPPGWLPGGACRRRYATPTARPTTRQTIASRRCASCRISRSRPATPPTNTVSEIEAALPRFEETPILLLWGEKDFVFEHRRCSRSSSASGPTPSAIAFPRPATTCSRTRPTRSRRSCSTSSLGIPVWPAARMNIASLVLERARSEPDAIAIHHRGARRTRPPRAPLMASSTARATASPTASRASASCAACARR